MRQWAFGVFPRRGLLPQEEDIIQAQKVFSRLRLARGVQKLLSAVFGCAIGRISPAKMTQRLSESLGVGLSLYRNAK